MENGGGIVVISFVVNPEGSTESIRILSYSGFPEIDEAAISCVSQLKYNPATRDGVPIAVTSKIELQFSDPYDPRPIGDHDCRNEAKAVDHAGPVGVTIHVDTSGVVTAVTLNGSSGDPTIDQSLIDCVSKWRYQPGMKLGKPEAWNLIMPALAIELGPE